MAHAIQSNFSQALIRHQNSMMSSLNHRLDVARAANDRRLIELLERERQQLEATYAVPQSTSQAIGDQLRNLVHRVRDWFAHRAELQVQEFVNGEDHWWYALDPQTGNFVYADSEAELRLWIKDHYRGR